MSLPVTDPRVRDLIGRAAEWRLLGLLLERPRQGWLEEVEAVSREVADPEIGAAVAAAREEATEGLYLALLGPGGGVSSREVSYRGMENPGQVLADIAAFYRAFAFGPETEEAADHLAVESGFLGYLCLKEAFALAGERPEAAEVARRAAVRFRAEHLSALAWSFAERLEEAGVRYLSLAAFAVARRSGPRPDRAAAAPPAVPPCEDAATECGFA